MKIGKTLGHEVAVFGEQSTDFPSIPFSLDVDKFDLVIFVVYETQDFPDLPYLARLLDGVPKDRRVVIDCTGRFNETIRVEHDFNHLEKLDNHQGGVLRGEGARRPEQLTRRRRRNALRV